MGGFSFGGGGGGGGRSQRFSSASGFPGSFNFGDFDDDDEHNGQFYGTPGNSGVDVFLMF